MNNINFEKIVAPFLRDLLEYNNLSQDQFAKDMGVSKAAVSQWLNGSSGIKTEKLYDIANYFGMSVEDIINGITPDSYFALEMYDLSHHASFRVIDENNIDELYIFLKKCKKVKKRTKALIEEVLGGSNNNKKISELNDALKCFKREYPVRKYKETVMNGIAHREQVTDCIALCEFLSNFRSDCGEYNYYLHRSLILNAYYDINFDSVLEFGDERAIELLMDVLDQEDIGWLLTNYIHDDLKNDKDVIEKSLPVKIMLSHGGECFYDCSEVLNIVSNEQIKLFEGTVIRETNKEDGLKTISELKDQSLDWRHLSYQNYRLIVDEKKTEYLKALVFLKDSDPLEFYKKVIKIYKIKDLECIY